MIISDKQLAISERELAKLQAARKEAALNASAKENWVAEVQASALDSMIADIETEINEYKMLRDGQISFSERYSLEELPRILVQARIAHGLTQSDLANQLGLKPQQIQRYEASDYMGASLSRLIDLARVLDVRISQSFTAPNANSSSMLVLKNLEDISLDRLQVDEMLKRGWFEPDSDQSATDAVLAYLQNNVGSSFVTALHRKKLSGKHMPDPAALLAWQARVLQIASERTRKSDIPEFDFRRTWLSDLVEITNNDNGPALVKDFLERRGILFIVEPHLQGSFLDGAAMLSHDDHPIVAMTLRFDRLDNFWFVLFHELGHVFLHLFKNSRFDFFDEDTSLADNSDPLESEANQFALDTLISQENWETCLSRFHADEETVRSEAKELGIHHSILAGRIRREKNDYASLDSLIGRDKVRRHFAGYES